MYVVRQWGGTLYYSENLEGSGTWVYKKSDATMYDLETALFVARLRDGIIVKC
jgi:hypothetical protein